ncbi:uncharacterized protein A4U43_C04F22360 [Asparagus officinalis]|uniref:Protein BPS1, chloroplastic n=1 Tax=Asparagus officinalis TaxID=4686 RepID=A0A5P1F4P8_ASPOF|nr:protein BPS1, chloroplastic-like [Asparagus officinalis]XP_020261697.1 protein BPS1, chloroplastic-like [Asparagus officinalis]ONK72713.1 uncharacterized protein A4U43_C04F22360 [Asparagus officinalis]
MSQPHDGHRTFLPFGNPFRMIFPKRSYLSPELVALRTSFEQTLAESLRKLKPKDISDICSLSWLRHAMSFLSETHNNIKSLITDLELPVSHWQEKWIDIYLDSSIKLLDICTAFSSELSRLDQGQVLLQYLLHALNSSRDSSQQVKKTETTLSEWMQQIESRSPKLEDCFSILQGLAGTVYSSKIKNSDKGKVLMRALYGVKVVTVFVCSVLTSVLSGCSKPLITLVVPNKYLWAEAFNDLQADVLKENISHISREKATVLRELGAVENCVKRLCALINTVDEKEEEMWHDSVSELAEAAKLLSLGLDDLSKQVDDFFRIVLMGRDALLSNLRVSDDVTMQESGDEVARV